MPLSGKRPQASLKPGIGAQVIEVVGVLIAAGNRQHACAQNVGDTVGHQQRIARIGDQRREPFGNTEGLLDRGEQHHAAIRGHASTVKRGGDFLALDGWETEWQQAIFEHGGCGSVRFGGNWLRHPNLCCKSDGYATSASESLPCDE